MEDSLDLFLILWMLVPALLEYHVLSEMDSGLGFSIRVFNLFLIIMGVIISLALYFIVSLMTVVTILLLRWVIEQALSGSPYGGKPLYDKWVIQSFLGVAQYRNSLVNKVSSQEIFYHKISVWIWVLWTVSYVPTGLVTSVTVSTITLVLIVILVIVVLELRKFRQEGREEEVDLIELNLSERTDYLSGYIQNHMERVGYTRNEEMEARCLLDSVESPERTFPIIYELDNFRIRFFYRTEGLISGVATEYEMESRVATRHLEISAEYLSKTPLSFRILRRSSFGDSWKIRGKGIGWDTDLRVQTTDYGLFEKLVDGTQLEDYLKGMEQELHFFIISGPRASLNLGIGLDIVRIRQSIDLVLDLRVLDGQSVALNDHYHCLNCGKLITFHGDVCMHCLAKAPRCVICFDDPEPGELIEELLCCNSYAHEKHLNTWLEINDSCPYCKQTIPDHIVIENLEFLSDL